MQALTLEFTDDQIEQSFQTFARKGAYPWLIGSCAVALKVASLLDITTDLPREAAGGLAGPLLLAAALSAAAASNTTRRWASQAVAGCWCVLWILAGFAPELNVIFALLQHLALLPVKWRLLTLAAVVVRGIVWPPSSELDRPGQTLLAIAALLLGELLGRPLELHRRTTFARGVLAASGAADTTANAAAAWRVHPLTLRWADSGLERAYSAHAFSKAFPYVAGGLFSTVALSCLGSLTVPKSLPLVAGACILMLIVFCASVWVRAQQVGAQQVHAQQRFAWCYGALMVLFQICRVAWRWWLYTTDIPREPMRAGVFTCVCCIHLIVANVHGLVAIPFKPRMVLLVSMVAGQACLPTLSNIGQPREALLNIAALILGEMLAHPLDLHRRAAYAGDVLRADNRDCQPLVHLLIFPDSNADLERAYAALSFDEAYPLFVALPLHLIALLVLLGLSAPALMPFAAGGGVITLALLAARVLAAHAEDQERAQQLFACVYCALRVLFVVCWMAYRWWATDGGLALGEPMSALLFMGVCSIIFIVALMQPVVGLPAPARLLVFVAVAGLHVVIHVVGTPFPVSTLGHSYESLLRIAAMLLGELLGRPFALHCHARDALPADCEATTPDSAASRCRVEMHPLTLSFMDVKVEQAYAGRLFAESYPLAFSFSFGLAASVGLLTLAAPHVLPITGSVAVFSLALLGARLQAHTEADRAQARHRFEVSWCVLWVMFACGISMAHRMELVSDMHSAEWTCVCIMYLCMSLVQRFLALSAGPRLLVLVATAIAHASGPVKSQFGQPLEARQRTYSSRIEDAQQDTQQ